jgi:Flp pilus assembly pilin Flp
MMQNLNQLWREDDGVLSFEWTLLVTLLTFGIVGGLATTRDAIIDELGDVAQAMLALDHSMTIDFPLSVIVHDASDVSSASASAFTDAAAFTDCARDVSNEGQAPRSLDDIDS